MTLQQFFDWVQERHMYILYYFLIFLILTLLASYYSKNEGNLSPWNNIYSFIIYAVCIPGIFACTLSIYFFLFEKRSIMDTELLLQVFPVFMMFLILYIIKRNVDLDSIPGFEKISGLLLVIGVVLSLMWIIDRTHIYAISFIPFYYVLFFLMGAIFVMRYAFKKMIN